ncbi:hypothetical protein AAG565_11745 [Fontimonas sp. SYSU GA230001]|uniref:hypothetical protein n=1 Tax=Fontimonas sp. SYSU GA230001 TaxID=3142450 RepID=UPI0032B4E330
MNSKNTFLTLFTIVLLALGLAGCQADADGSLNAGPGGNGTGQVDPDDGIDNNGNPTGSGDNTDTGLPNDGSTGGLVLEGNTPIAGDGSNPPRNFVCTKTAQIFFGASTEVGANGLVGGPLSALVSLLGGASVVDLLNSVKDKDLAIDGDLKTAAAFTQTASLLGLAQSGLVDALDLTVSMPSGVTIPAGQYAVFGLSFPPGLLNLGLLTNVRVTTFLNNTQQENPVELDATAIDLLGQGVVGPVYAFVGRKVTKPYNKARISLEGDLLAVDLGDAMFVHELCTAGTLVVPKQ